MKTKCLFAFLILALCAFFMASCGAKTPERIAIYSDPDSLVVVQGSSPDLSGGAISVYYADGSRKTVPMDSLEIRSLNTDEPGEQTMVLVYKHKKRSFSVTLDVTVVRAAVTELTLTAEGVKTDYFEGETFDNTGLVVTAKFESGDSTVVDVYEISPLKLSAGDTRVTVRYRGFSSYLDVSVRAIKAERIEVLSLPAKTEYFVGEFFSSEGFSGKIVYTDGAEEPLDKYDIVFLNKKRGIFLSPADPADNIVRVEAETEKGVAYCEFPLKVTPITPVSMVCLAGEPLSFFEGDLFDLSDRGVTFDVTYNDGSTSSIVGGGSEFFFSEEPLAAGKTSVRVHLAGHEVFAEVPVSVAPVKVSELSVFSYPAKTTYFIGENLDLSGLVLKAVYNNGGTEFVSFSPSSGISSNKTDAGAEEGSVTIALSFGGETAELSLTVIPRPSPVVINLEIKNADSLKTEYSVGEAFDLSAAVFLFSLEGGASLEVPYESAEVTLYAVVESAPEETKNLLSSVALENTVAVLLSVSAADGDGAVLSFDVLLPVNLNIA